MTSSLSPNVSTLVTKSTQSLSTNNALDESAASTFAHDLIELHHANRRFKQTLFAPEHAHLHNVIFGTVVSMLICCQLGLIIFKARNPKLFKRVTLVLMHLLPPGFSIVMSFWRFVVIFALYLIVAGKTIFDATRVPLQPKTPRRVYRFFLLIFQLSYGAAGIGYSLLIIEFWGLNTMLSPALGQMIAGFSLTIIFYGLYYGMLARDTAEWCSDRMSASLGFGGGGGGGGGGKDDDDLSLPRRAAGNACLICGDQLVAIRRDDTPVERRLYKLACGHEFHESCLRGWTIVGKRGFCPACREKVRFEETFLQHPWLRTAQLWTQVECTRRRLFH
jgi:RING finger protein 121